MTYIRSYTHIERELMHHYRRQLSHAESEEDIKKFFAQTMQHLLREVMKDEVRVDQDDATLKPESPPYYRISDQLNNRESFRKIRKQSDLNAVLKRFAEPAVKHCQHLKGHPEKTRAKIRHHT